MTFKLKLMGKIYPFFFSPTSQSQKGTTISFFLGTTPFIFMLGGGLKLYHHHKILKFHFGPSSTTVTLALFLGKLEANKGSDKQ